MFSREGAARTERQNRLVAGCLAAVGGFVNSSGFVLVGTFTSHVTGNVGRLANDLALEQYAAALGALGMIVAFFTGAFAASMIVESQFWGGHVSRAYAYALAVEAALLIAFTVISQPGTQAHPRVRDAEALLLCSAMGMQNSLVTRLSGAVVRTTHLTGVVTDLGIEAARWFRFWRLRVSNATRVRLLFGRNLPERPAAPKVRLLVTIVGSFLLGASLGALSAIRLRHWAMIVAALAVAACSAYAAQTSPLERSDAPPPR